ncbi:hypothetical protein BaRGS_00022416, partial [Batillaria attramentaria]
IISSIGPSDTKDLLKRVLEEMFKTGEYNWGRVAAVFAFAFRLCAKALLEKWKVSLVRYIIHPVLLFFRERIAPWIVGIGGWHTILTYVQEQRLPFLNPVMTTVAERFAYFAAGFLLCMLWYSWFSWFS